MSMGRHRKRDAGMPVHIEQAKLPNYCYWDSDKKHWYTKAPYTLSDQVREHIAGKTATLAELHSIMESRSGQQPGTFDWLTKKYEKSEKFSNLEPKTQKNYQRSKVIISTHDTKKKIPLGKTLINQWDDKMVQRLIDDIGKVNGPTAANECLKYIRNVTQWGKKRGYCKEKLGIDVDRLKERQQRRLPDSIVLKDLINLAYERGQRKTKSKGSCRPYLWCALIIGYELRARGIETNKLTDADISDIGLKNERVKGSNTNITKWSDALIQAIRFLIEYRNKIWEKKRFPVPVKPSDRPLFVTETGTPLKKSSLETAFYRLILIALDEGIMTEDQRFGLHDLKRRGTTDTQGTSADKMEGTGHKTTSMLEIYDFSVAVVNPVSEQKS